MHRIGSVIFIVFAIALATWWYVASAPTKEANDTAIENTATVTPPHGESIESTDDTTTETEERLPVAKGDYRVNPRESVFGWSGQKPLINGYINTGTVAVQEGSITITEDDSVGGTFTIDMNTIDVGLTAMKPGAEDALEQHLKGEAFFNVATYPTATFTITESEKIDTFNYRITGDLTMRGKTNAVTFDTNAFSTNDNQAVTVVAQFEIDRTQWGLTVGSGSFFDTLGDKVIADEIRLDLVLVANRL